MDNTNEQEIPLEEDEEEEAVLYYSKIPEEVQKKFEENIKRLMDEIKEKREEADD